MASGVIYGTTSAEDSTANKNIGITAKFSVAQAATKLATHLITVEKIT